ncbi:hypothetical protein B4U79_09149 [Dinothrombium tinctorium]|uniref:Uncharacterized protein n=1 Tax=Dinothrombium tinctorium TaxID=1965070 RepID=A0A3S3P686_9ACAR|nr:hypothetical protein B4U79_09149 [Dinothrombium tinctorium]
MTIVMLTIHRGMCHFHILMALYWKPAMFIDCFAHAKLASLAFRMFVKN